MRYSLVACALICAAMLVNVAPLHAATLYDANADFSIAANPNSPWTYGYYNTAATVFTPYAGSTASWHANSNISGWSQFLYDSASYSVVGRNNAGTVQGEGSAIVIDPGFLFTHPGANGEKGTIRWTATEEGYVDITAMFIAADNTANGNRDVHVYLNGSEIYGASLIGAKPNSVSAGGSLSDILVTPGTTIDWAVGFGAGGYGNDATMLVAELSFSTPAPEPSSMLLLGMGTLGLIARRRRSAVCQR